MNVDWEAKEVVRQRSGRVHGKRRSRLRAGQPRAVIRSAIIVALIGSLIAGAFAMVIGMGAGDRWWLGWVSLLPVFVAIRWLSPWRAMLCGALWGASVYGVSVYAVRGGVQPAVPALVLLVFVPGLYGCLGSWFTRWYRCDPLVLGVGWIGVELALLPLGMRSGLLGGTQGDGLLFDLIGNFLGYVFVGFVVAWVSALLLALLGAVRWALPAQRLSVETIPPAGCVPREVPLYLRFLPRHQVSPRAPPV